MHDIAGLVALAAIGLWIAYLVPHRLRYRQQLLESRTEDRFSDALRVLVVADAGRRGALAAQARAECGPDSAKRSGLLSPARGVPVRARSVVTNGEGGVVERPYGTQDKISADDARRAAQQRARRAAAVSRRAAAARRRAALTGVLLVASVVAWAVVGLSAVSVVAAVAPTVLLGGVVLLGRRAAISARRDDAAWERRQAERAARPAAPRTRVTGRAHRPSDSHTEAIARVGSGTRESAAVTTATPVVAATDEAGDAERADGTVPVASAGSDETSDAPAAVVGDADAATPTALEATVAAASDGWSPVPVPRPTYTTKATAPRREPLPLVVEEPLPAAAPVAATEPAAADDVPPVDLDAILARRRAAGE